MPARVRSLLLAAALAVVAVAGRASAAAAPAAGRADFSGAWALDERSSVDPSAKVEPDADDIGEGRRGGGRGASSGAGWSAGAPLEATVAAGRIVVVDDGATVRITYPSGRKRVFLTDGEERELDDGGGPAKVTAKRRGDRGEKIVVSSSWSTGRGLAETWELLSSPRRLVVTAKVKSRPSFSYKRVYDPAPDLPAASPTPRATIPGADVPGAVAPAPPPVVRATMAECSIRPPKGTSGPELARLAKITLADAEARAIASLGAAKVSSVISSDVEVDDGCLVFPLDLRLADRSGVYEILIDAGDGKVLSSEFTATKKD